MSIMDDLNNQIKREGLTDDNKLLLAVADAIIANSGKGSGGNAWRELTTVEWVGHTRLYRPNNLLRDLLAIGGNL